MTKAKPRRKSGKPKQTERPVDRLLKRIVQALDAKKAEDLQVLDVSAVSSITDYLVITTGGSEPHLRALRIELERVLDEEKARIVGVDNERGSGWTVVDAFEIMIHVLTPDNRAKFQLEALWKDSQPVDLKTLLKD